MIPDADLLFMRIHRTYVQKGALIAGVFCDKQGAMSTDWQRYSTAEETRARGRVPADNGVVSLPTGGVRKLGQAVMHSPIDTNRAHTSVVGDKKTDPEVRLKLLRLTDWLIAI